MQHRHFPVIDLVATGANIRRLREARGLSIRDLQSYFGFEEPRAIYKWQAGQSLPTVDNLFALSACLEVPMEDILVERGSTHTDRHAKAPAVQKLPAPVFFFVDG